MFYIRKSAIEDYKFCPMRFRKTWIEGIERQANQAMLMGTRFHEFAKLFFTYTTGVDPDSWEELIPEEFNETERSMALWFVQYERQRLLELTVDGKSEDWQPILLEVGMKDDILGLAGTMDRADWIDKGLKTIRLVEYKTGKKINDDSIIRQLAFYTILWESTMHLGTIMEYRIINPRAQVVKDYKVHSYQMDRVLKDIVAIRAAMRENQYLAKCSNVKLSMCRMCTPEECGAYGEASRT